MPLTLNNPIKRILVFGEILFDVYPSEKHLGGAPLNFAYHLHHLGFRVKLLSAVGNDEKGREILDFLSTEKMDCSLIQKSQEYPSGEVRVSLDEQGSPEYDILMPVAWDDISQTRPGEQEAACCDLFYFGSLCLRSEKSRASLFALLEKIKKDVPVFFDINLRQNYYSQTIIEKSLQNCTILKCNLDEFDVLSEYFSLSDSEHKRLSQLSRMFKINTIILTKGEKGSLLFDSTGVFELELKSDMTKSVIDTVGAGDAFSALFVYGKLRHWDVSLALRRASDFAEKICAIKGALPHEKKMYQKILLF
ncbi:MAG: carbohydrate kinase [Spirochaetales bacterium]|nr:carbohydrate kinase [Spirochaetales bacterium]